jgi:hypothetical protein
MSYVSGSKTYDYGIHAARPDVPPSLSSSSLPRPINSQVQIVSLSSASGSQQASGLITFQIPTGPSAGYLKNNSLYLKARVRLNNAAALTGNACFALNSRSASAIVNRLTVSIGGVQVSQVNNYQYLHEILLVHTTSFNYYTNDSAILQNTGDAAAFPNGAAANAFVDIVIPLICPLWNANKSVPLFLIDSPIKVDIDLNSVANALKAAVPADFTNYSVENAQLVYEQLQVDADFVNEVKMAMMQGSLYQLNLNDFYTITTSSSAALNYQIGASLSSVRGVVYTQVKNAPTVGTDTVLFKNGQTNCRVYMDGRQLNNFNLDNDAQIFCEMQRCFGIMFDSNITTATNKANYLALDFAAGVSSNKVSDQMAMTGTKVQNINLQLDSTGGANNTYIVVLHDKVLTIDGMGKCQLVQ